MKVCILSMQRVGNMGSLLQSYALKTTIERLGHQVEFIDIEKREDDYKLLGDYKQKYDKEKETTGLIGKIKKTDRYALNRLRIKKKSIDQENVFEESVYDRFNLSWKPVSAYIEYGLRGKGNRHKEANADSV